MNINCKGISLAARKNHCATVYGKSMVVFGGQTETGTLLKEMAILQLDLLEWTKINLKADLTPFA